MEDKKKLRREFNKAVEAYKYPQYVLPKNLMTFCFNWFYSKLTKDQWISVKERLPERIGCYLTFTSDEIQMVCHINALGDWTLSPPKNWYGDIWGTDLKSPRDRTITHWKPLDQPPIKK